MTNFSQTGQGFMQSEKLRKNFLDPPCILMDYLDLLSG